MKLVLALFLAVAVVSAAPPLQQNPQQAQILRYDFDNAGIDNYNYNIELSDGQSKQEQGQLQNAGSESESLVVRGQFSYVSPEGQNIVLSYVADENGFRPEGAHLPQPQQ